jgi:uncharacterized membrane protein YkvA (DUF1232 family)
MRSSKRSGFSLAGLLGKAQLIYRLYQDDRVPTLLKVAVPLVVALYFISPIDLIPDFILGLGELDDLGVLLLGMSMFVSLAPREVVAEHNRALGLADSPPGDGRTTPLPGRPATPRTRTDDVVDAFYKVINREK